MKNPLTSIGRAFAGTLNRRSLENPAYSLDDPALYEMFGGGIRSNAGVTVSRQAALSLSTMWRGVNLISDGVASLGLHRMVRTDGEGKERDTTNPTYRLVNSRPNEYMTAYVFIKTLTAHAIFGNGYAYIERDRSGMARGLLPLYPHCTYPVRENGRLLYVTQVSRLDGSSEQRKLEAADVIHLKGLSYDGLMGYHLIDVMADTIGGALATRTHAVKFFKDGTLTSGVIEVPGAMDDKAKKALVDNWHKMYSGIDNAHRTALLTHGAKFNAMGMDADKAQLLESRVFDRVEIANVLGLPPHKLGDDSQVSYNSLESSERAVLKDSINPWLKAWETECDAKLLTEDEQANYSHCYRFNRMAAIQSDSKTTAETLGLEIEKGLITVDEARERLSLPPLDNGLGRVIFRPQSNMVPVSIDAPDEPEPDDEEPQDPPQMDDTEYDGARSVLIESAKDLLNDGLGRMKRRIAGKAKRAANKPDTFIEFVESIEADHGEVYDEIIAPAGRLVAVCGEDATRYRATFFDCMRNALLTAAEVEADKLGESVQRHIDAIDIGDIIKGLDNGTSKFDPSNN